MKERNDAAYPGRSELPLGRHHETTELPAGVNHVSELAGDRKHTTQRDQKEVVGASTGLADDAQNQPPKPVLQTGSSSRILDPNELAWDEHRPSFDIENGGPAREALSERLGQSLGNSEGRVRVLELGDQRGQVPELGSGQQSVKQKPVELPQATSTVSGQAPMTSKQTLLPAFGNANPDATARRPVRRGSF
jgi:hypothetical protein